MNNFEKSKLILEAMDMGKVLFFQAKSGKINSGNLDYIVEWIEDEDKNHYMTVNAVYMLGDYTLAVVPHGQGGENAFASNFAKGFGLKRVTLQGVL